MLACFSRETSPSFVGMHFCDRFFFVERGRGYKEAVYWATLTEGERWGRKRVLYPDESFARFKENERLTFEPPLIEMSLPLRLDTYLYYSEARFVCFRYDNYVSLESRVGTLVCCAR